MSEVMQEIRARFDRAALACMSSSLDCLAQAQALVSDEIEAFGGSASRALVFVSRAVDDYVAQARTCVDLVLARGVMPSDFDGGQLLSQVGVLSQTFEVHRRMAMRDGFDRKAFMAGSGLLMRDVGQQVVAAMEQARALAPQIKSVRVEAAVQGGDVGQVQQVVLNEQSSQRLAQLQEQEKAIAALLAAHASSQKAKSDRVQQVAQDAVRQARS